MGSRDVNSNEDKTLKTQFAKAQRRTWTPNRAETPTNTAGNDGVGDQQDSEHQIAQQETDDDRIPPKERKWLRPQNRLKKQAMIDFQSTRNRAKNEYH